MLIDSLNECIIDMKTVREMETASADTKKQATADYNFKQLILSLKQMIDEVNLAVENSEFRPSENAIKLFRQVRRIMQQTSIFRQNRRNYMLLLGRNGWNIILKQQLIY